MLHSPITKPMQKSRHAYGRFLRIALGIFLLALFAYALLPGTLLSPHQAGRVNAELVTLRAPIDGRIAYADINVGDRVEAGQTLAVLRDPPERDIRLPDLEARLRSLQERIAGIDGQIAALSPILERLESQSQDFRAAVIASLDAQIAEAIAEVKRAEAGIRLADSQLKRIQPLAAASYASAASLDLRRAEAETARANLTARQQVLERLQKEREAAAKGVYLSDSYNNAPYSQQRRDDVELQRLTLISRKSELVAEHDQLSRQIETEQRRRSLMGEAVIAAPVNGVLWRLAETEQATIGIGSAIIQIADCNRLFFEVLRERRGEETPAIGSTTDVEFSEAGETVTRKARLVALRGDADSDRREFAITSGSTADQLRLLYAIEGDAGNTTAACPVGQSGRLSSGVSPIEQLARRLMATFQ